MSPKESKHSSEPFDTTKHLIRAKNRTEGKRNVQPSHAKEVDQHLTAFSGDRHRREYVSELESLVADLKAKIQELETGQSQSVSDLEDDPEHARLVGLVGATFETADNLKREKESLEEKIAELQAAKSCLEEELGDARG